MSGIGLLLNVGKDALLAQQAAIDVVGHNIANVNTEGYSRQAAVLEPKQAAAFMGFMFGRGVEVDQIVRETNAFIETRLRQRESDLGALAEKDVYMSVMEGIFNESSEGGLSSQLSEFWNDWQDLANNPSGFAERSVLCETGALLSQSFNSAHNELESLNDEINKGLEAGVDNVNRLLAQIADLNQQIIVAETRGPANDLRDKRSALISQLSEYLDIKTYENDNGSVSVMTGRGYTLVHRSDVYQLDFEDSEVKWEGSNGAKLTITDTIAGGKLGGWLDIRDEAIPKYEADLDELARTIVWEINKVHSQGVGLEAFSDIVAAYGAGDADRALGSADSGLAFYDGVADGSFKFWLYDATGAVMNGGPTTLTIDKDAGGTTLNDLATAITAINADVTATVGSDNRLRIATAGGCTFAFSDDTSNVLSALGLNVFFSGTDANTMAVNSVVSAQKGFIAAAKADADGAFASGDNANALEIADLQYKKIDMARWIYERGSGPTDENVSETTLEDYLHTLAGAVGVQSQSVRREMEYSEVIVNQLRQTRDGISAVSIDEEMTNLIKYQQAYAAAAKLISTADEMISTLLETK